MGGLEKESEMIKRYILNGARYVTPKITLLRFERKLEDFWVGVFWRETTVQIGWWDEPNITEIWICFIPCLPLHICIQWMDQDTNVKP